MQTLRDIVFHDHHPQLSDFRGEVLEGLLSEPKRISPKFFYDRRGSELFERICELDEYYPTRTEISILKENAPDIADRLGRDCVLIEYGSGNSRKVRILLDTLEGNVTYLAIDISKGHLRAAASDLAESYPGLEVIAVCADYTRPFPLPETDGSLGHRAVFFPGSTIGNFSPEQALSFLRTTARQVGPGGSLLIGVDLKKDNRILHAAYNDVEGVTAAFNLNLLARINREMDADFDLAAFRHQAYYNAEGGRIEMHLVSLKPQTVQLNGSRIRFDEGETIHTENSYKFSIAEFQQIARQAGFQPVQVWTDSDNLFSLHDLTVPS
jgi:dimethylhistidine N-methyltransferase